MALALKMTLLRSPTIMFSHVGDCNAVVMVTQWNFVWKYSGNSKIQANHAELHSVKSLLPGYMHSYTIHS